MFSREVFPSFLRGVGPLFSLPQADLTLPSIHASIHPHKNSYPLWGRCCRRPEASSWGMKASSLPHCSTSETRTSSPDSLCIPASVTVLWRPSSHHRPPTPPPPQRSAAQYSPQHTQPFRRSEDRDKARANSSHSDLLVCYFCFQQFSLSKSKLKRLWADRRAAELNQSSLKVHIKQAAVRLQLLIWTFCFVW